MFCTNFIQYKSNPLPKLVLLLFSSRVNLFRVRQQYTGVPGRYVLVCFVPFLVAPFLPLVYRYILVGMYEYCIFRLPTREVAASRLGKKVLTSFRDTNVRHLP